MGRRSRLGFDAILSLDGSDFWRRKVETQNKNMPVDIKRRANSDNRRDSKCLVDM